jgi:hypothetical protein
MNQENRFFFKNDTEQMCLAPARAQPESEMRDKVVWSAPLWLSTMKTVTVLTDWNLTSLSSCTAPDLTADADKVNSCVGWEREKRNGYECEIKKMLFVLSEDKSIPRAARPSEQVQNSTTKTSIQM